MLKPSPLGVPKGEKESLLAKKYRNTKQANLSLSPVDWDTQE
jgi:hypothetical protein